MRLEESEVELGHLVQVCVGMVADRAAVGGITLTTDAGAAPCRIWADERRARQILLNLLTNAIKFTADGGNVTIRLAWTADGGVQVTVADTGVGISEDDRERILEPFMRGDSSYVRSRDGTGLGLPLVKRLAESHEATLTLESEFGVGTTVTVTFPPARILA